MRRASSQRKNGARAAGTLRLTIAAEATLKLAGICLLSEGAYRYGSEPAKKVIGEAITGHIQGWGAVLDVSARLPGECELARRLLAEPAAGDRVHALWTQMDELLTRELDVVSMGMTKRRSFVWRHALRFVPFLRNKVKGHGAPPARLYAQLNPLLRETVQHAIADLIAPIPPALALVRTMREGHGLFLRLGSPTKEVELPIEVATLRAGDVVLAADSGQIPLVPLMTFDERTRALLLFNDSVAEATGELEYIDYVQGQFARRPAHFVTRHGFAELAASETTASPVLCETPGIVPNNLPERRRAHVPRRELEAELTKYLLDDKHRIISLDGRGGIGKTYLATEVCRRLAEDPAAGNRFGFILWMSARDVDLTVTGPKPVRQDLDSGRRTTLRFAGVRRERGG
jgi:hypothetical protein